MEIRKVEERRIVQKGARDIKRGPRNFANQI
jgi:hypothetical protein